MNQEDVAVTLGGVAMDMNIVAALIANTNVGALSHGHYYSLIKATTLLAYLNSIIGMVDTSSITR